METESRSWLSQNETDELVADLMCLNITSRVESFPGQCNARTTRMNRHTLIQSNQQDVFPFNSAVFYKVRVLQTFYSLQKSVFQLLSLLLSTLNSYCFPSNVKRWISRRSLSYNEYLNIRIVNYRFVVNFSCTELTQAKLSSRFSFQHMILGAKARGFMTSGRF